MVFKNVLGNIKDKSYEDFDIETITISSDNLLKKVMRVTSDFDIEYGIDLKESGDTLEEGAILYKDDKKIILLEVEKEKCIIIKPKNMNQMGEIAHYLGNMHMPVEIKDSEILLHYDTFLEEALKEKKIDFSVENRKLDKALKHVEFGHKH